MRFRSRFAYLFHGRLKRFQRVGCYFQGTIFAFVSADFFLAYWPLPRGRGKCSSKPCISASLLTPTSGKTLKVKLVTTSNVLCHAYCAAQTIVSFGGLWHSCLYGILSQWRCLNLVEHGVYVYLDISWKRTLLNLKKYLWIPFFKGEYIWELTDDRDNYPRLCSLEGYRQQIHVRGQNDRGMRRNTPTNIFFLLKLPKKLWLYTRI